MHKTFKLLLMLGIIVVCFTSCNTNHQTAFTNMEKFAEKAALEYIKEKYDFEAEYVSVFAEETYGLYHSNGPNGRAVVLLSCNGREFYVHLSASGNFKKASDIKLSTISDEYQYDDISSDIMAFYNEKFPAIEIELVEFSLQTDTNEGFDKSAYYHGNITELIESGVDISVRLASKGEKGVDYIGDIQEICETTNDQFCQIENSEFGMEFSFYDAVEAEKRDYSGYIEYYAKYEGNAYAYGSVIKYRDDENHSIVVGSDDYFLPVNKVTGIYTRNNQPNNDHIFHEELLHVNDLAVQIKPASAAALLFAQEMDFKYLTDFYTVSWHNDQEREPKAETFYFGNAHIPRSDRYLVFLDGEEVSFIPYDTMFYPILKGSTVAIAELTN